MSNIAATAFANGYVSARDPYDFAPGELKRALAATYRPGDSRVWKQLGRTTFGAASGGIKGLALCLFDNGSDYLVAYSGTVLEGATPGTTGTFASLTTGLSASGTTLTSVQQDDRWYLGNGVDRNRVLSSDGTVRLHGLQSPSTAPVVTVGANSGAADSYPAAGADGSGWVNVANARDSNDETFASATLSAAATVTHTWTGWGASTASNRSLEIKWWLAGLPNPGDAGGGGTIGTGGVVDSGYQVLVKLEKSEDSGGAWTTIFQGLYSGPPSSIQTVPSTLTQDSSAIHFRATLEYRSGTNPATLQIHTAKIKTGAAGAAFSASLYYAVSWHNATDGMSGPPKFSALATFVAGSGHNSASIAQPANPEAAATHWQIWRTPDAFPDTLASFFLVATVPIDETTYLDPFDIAADDVGPETIPLLTLGDLNFPLNSPPPSFGFMWVHQGSIFGLSETTPRAMYYSESGYPESYPEMYVIPAYALDEHDRLLCGTSLGLTSVIFAEGAVLSVDSPPRVVDGQFDAGQALPIKGHPGCVGRMAMTPYSVSGEARAAWVSPFGIYTTNGSTCERISDDLAWENEVTEATLYTSVLKWDAKYLRLVFEFDSDGDGVNDREAFIHMAHVKQSGQPKWSQPTPKRTSALAHGLVDFRYRRYSGHPTDGTVYLEESGGEDDATGEAISMDVETGQDGSGRLDSACLKALLLHSDWGEEAEGTLTVTAHMRGGASTQVVTKQVSLEGQRGHEVMIARAGEKFSVRFQHDESDTGAILGVELEMQRQGRSGSANRWQTVAP